MDRPFLYCPACGEVGRDPGRVVAEPAFEPGDDPLDPLTPDFRRRHAGHGLRLLSASPDAYVSEAAYGAGARLAFHEAEDRDGTRYVVEARREGPGRPCRFRLRRGGLVRIREAITVDAPAIARVVAQAIGREVDGELLALAARLAEVALAGARAAGFGALEAAAAAGPTPLVAHAPLPEPAIPPLFAALRAALGDGGVGKNDRSLSPTDAARLLELHAGPGGAFAPVLETAYSVVGASGAVESHLRRVRVDRDTRLAARP